MTTYWTADPSSPRSKRQAANGQRSKEKTQPKRKETNHANHRHPNVATLAFIAVDVTLLWAGFGPLWSLLLGTSAASTAKGAMDALLFAATAK